RLVAQGFGRDVLVFGVPLGPVFPLIAAAPARHHENAHLIGQVEEVLVLQLAFHAHRVEMKVANIFQLLALLFRSGTQQQVKAVAGAPDQDVLAVDLKPAVTLLVEFGCHLANAETTAAGVGNLAVNVRLQVESVETLRTYRRRPPQPRMRKFQLRKSLRSEVDDLSFFSGKSHRLLEL